LRAYVVIRVSGNEPHRTMRRARAGTS